MDRLPRSARQDQPCHYTSLWAAPQPCHPMHVLERGRRKVQHRWAWLLAEQSTGPHPNLPPVQHTPIMNCSTVDNRQQSMRPNPWTFGQLKWLTHLEVLAHLHQDLFSHLKSGTGYACRQDIQAHIADLAVAWVNQITWAEVGVWVFDKHCLLLRLHCQSLQAWHP